MFLYPVTIKLYKFYIEKYIKSKMNSVDSIS